MTADLIGDLANAHVVHGIIDNDLIDLVLAEPAPYMPLELPYYFGDIRKLVCICAFAVLAGVLPSLSSVLY